MDFTDFTDFFGATDFTDFTDFFYESTLIGEGRGCGSPLLGGEKGGMLSSNYWQIIRHLADLS